MIEIFRVGNGYDVHRLVKDRKLILGGVNIPFHRGLHGHSDADVLVHAIMDALLGACGERDIGKHFPDKDSQYKDINSMILLDKVKLIVKNKGYKIGNIDATIVAELPKLSPYIEEMKSNVARVLEIEDDLVNIKATTEEGLGLTGTGEGMASYAVVGLYR